MWLPAYLYSMNKGIRIKLFLAQQLNISHPDAEALITKGVVKVAGKKASFHTLVKPGEEVIVNNEPVRERTDFLYLAYNKPPGIECTLDPTVANNLPQALALSERVFPIGRLDKDSEGLLLLTNDGRIVNKILRSEEEKEKEYVVIVNRAIDESFVNAMMEGVVIMGKKTKPARLLPDASNDKMFRLILTEGMNRQIRRMCHQLNYQVKKLRRIRVMNIRIGSMKSGEIRNLSEEELDGLFGLLDLER